MPKKAASSVKAVNVAPIPGVRTPPGPLARSAARGWPRDHRMSLQTAGALAVPAWPPADSTTVPTTKQ